MNEIFKRLTQMEKYKKGQLLLLTKDNKHIKVEYYKNAFYVNSKQITSKHMVYEILEYTEKITGKLFIFA